MKHQLPKKLLPILVVALGGIAAGTVLLVSRNPAATAPSGFIDTALAARFDTLSKNGNSSCSGSFTASIASMPDGNRIQGSCCSPMNPHRYTEQVEGLKKYKGIAIVPPDPYDIDAALAKELKAAYDLALTPAEQQAYDYAMANSMEKGPCCCKCWRWYVYGGLAKKLIKEQGFTGEQVTDIWNLSDGCGGAGDHATTH